MRLDQPPAALAGLRVIDAGQIIAGPFAATLLGEFGAEVIKVEQPGVGDQGRGPDGRSAEFAQNARNKRSITLDLRRPDGQALFKRLVAVADVVVENFRPGTLERWGLGYEALSAVNPGIVLLRVSGYGQTGPYRHRYSFDRIGMAFGGLTYVTGHPDRPPVRPGFFIADYVAGLWGAFGVLAALRARDATGLGQVVDVSLYETILRLSGSLAADYARAGVVRERQGNTMPGVSPADQFETADERYLVLHAGTDRVFARLAATMGRPELADDPRFRRRADRAAHREALHAIIGEWLRTMTLAEGLRTLEAGGVPASAVNSIADIFHDPHVAARENLIPVADALLGEMVQLGVVPRLARTPGAVRAGAPRLGEHNEAVYLELLALPRPEYHALCAAGVI